MSKATKKKHVARELLEEFVVPAGNQSVVKVVCGRGNNLHEVASHCNEHFLVSMPSKFRRSVWIKRGDYVIVEPIAEGNRVKAEIVHILYPKHVRYLKQRDMWPAGFAESAAVEAAPDSSKPSQLLDEGSSDCSD